MSWVIRNSRSSASDLIGSVWVSIVVLLCGPNGTRSENSLFSDTDLMELVIVTTSQVSSGFLNDFETPGFTITMSGIDKSLIGTIYVDSNNSTVIVTENNLVVKEIDS
jgi:hypothetical protein